jgi:hypothetical protein
MLLAVIAFVPFPGLLILLLLKEKTTKVLQLNGLTVGLFGATLGL